MAPAHNDLIHPKHTERFQGLSLRVRKVSALAFQPHALESRVSSLLAAIIVALALFFCISGSAIAATVTAHFTSASSIPVTASSYTAKGNNVNLSLGFAPAPGSDLTVVKNTGLPFIAGQFGNLRQGQEIGLNYGGIIYHFVANYFGGSGNDLVLIWKRRAVYSWGGNGHGQLGDDSTTLRRLPIAVNAAGVLSGKTVIALAGGKYHSVALCSEGTVVAWGQNGSGQLGNGNTVESKIPARVVSTGVLSGKTVVNVSAGGTHNLALCSDGSIAAWGNNSRGQLGNRSATSSNVPVMVDTTGVLSGKKVVAVAAGGSHSLALCSDGTLVAWGLNSNGQLGNNSQANKKSPVLVDTRGILSRKQVVAVSAGDNFSLALCSDGSVTSWGANASGQLGNNSFKDSAFPVLVKSTGVLRGKKVVVVSAGTTHSLALCSDGTPVAWGSNKNGQLGNGGNTNKNYPVQVVTSGALAGKKVSSVSAGNNFSLAIYASGEVAAWGTNGSGELGNNSMTRRSVPGLVDASGLGNARAKAINAGFGHGLVVAALPASSELRSLAVSAGSLSPAFSPEITAYQMKVATGITAISFTPTARDASVISINGTKVVSGTSRSVALHDGFNPISIQVIGGSGEPRVYTIVVIKGTAVDIRFDSPDAMSIPAGEVDFSGLDANFSLGFAPATGTELMVVRNTGLPFIAGKFANLAQGQPVDITYNGITYKFVANYFGGTGNDLVLQWAYRDLCTWGLGSDNRLGNPDSHTTGVPKGISNSSILAGKSIIHLSSGAMHTLALCSDGSLIGWGSNSQGQLVNGDIGSNFSPRMIPAEGALAGKSLVAVSAGLNHSLALCADGTVAAWGAGAEGQLGNNQVDASGLPVAVEQSGALAGRKVVAISAGATHNLALCGDGTVVAWGSDEYGKLGDGKTVNRAVPVAVAKTGALAGKSVIAVNAAYSHSSVLCSDGTVVAWGRNSSGQLGNGQTVDSLLPVQVATTGVLAGKTVTAISGKGDFMLALCSDGTLAAWGTNLLGELGDGTMTVRNAPVLVKQDGALAGKKFRTINGGYSSAAATCSDGTLATWGYNYYGELGVVTEALGSLVPLVVNPRGDISDRNVLEAQAGAHFRMALVAAPLSADSKLAVLSVSPGVMDYGLGESNSDYEVSVPQGTTSVSITAAARDAMAKVTFNGNIVPSGSAIAIPLVGGTAVATLVVIAEDGTTSTYQVKVSSGHDIAYTFNSAAGPALVRPAFDATGAAANLVLGFAPETGTELLVVNNTGLSFIRGEFSNLSQGQEVGLNYNGIVYRFVADYNGGSGNDLVLRWLRQGLSTWGANQAGQLGDGGKPYERRTPFNVLPAGALAGKTPISVSVGSSHALAVCSDGTVAAWGSNSSRQLGDGTTISRDTPVVANPAGLLTGKKVVSVATGSAFSLALCSDGTALRWGTSNVVISSSGALAGKTVVALSAGSSHGLALCSDGTVAAWGENTYGQLGNGSGPYASSLPVAVNTSGALAGKTVVSISAGGNSSFALCSDGSVAAWGENTSGQLGNNSTANAIAPVTVDTTGVLLSRKVVSISAGVGFCLGLCSDGAIVSWGSNGLGQLGNGTTTTSSIPVLVNAGGVLAGKSVTSLSAGGSHGMALCSDGTLATWGNNNVGSLGIGSTTSSNIPISATGSGGLAGRRVCLIEAGAGSSMAIAAIPPGTALAGLAPDKGTLAPAFSPEILGYSMVFETGTTSLAVTPTALDASLIKVNGVSVVSGTPSGAISLHEGLNKLVIDVAGDTGTVSSYVISVVVGNTASVVFNSAADVPIDITNFNCSGISITASLGFAPSLGTNLTLMRNGGIASITGQFSNLAQGQAVDLSFNGTTYQFVANYYGGTGNDLVLEWRNRSVASWGENGNGQAGDGTLDSHLVPVAVDSSGVLSGKTVVSLAPASANTLALCADGTLAQWGKVVGDVQTVPVSMNDQGALQGKQVVSVAAGSGTYLALCADGSMAAWGYNGAGQLGDGSSTSSTIPVQVISRGALVGKTVVAASIGAAHCLVICSDGTMVSWGHNAYGQLGNGTTTGAVTDPPVQVLTTGVLAGKKVIAIGTGLYHSVALCADGTLVSWGDASNGRLGNRTPFGTFATPQLVYAAGVLAGKAVVNISVSTDNTAVICSDGTLAAWGDNTYGQLGNGTTAHANEPKLVNTSGVLGGKTVVSVSVGDRCMFATCADGSVAAWGRNIYGELGDGTIINRSLPVLVDTSGEFSGKRAIAAASGGYPGHSHAILASLPAASIPSMASPAVEMKLAAAVGSDPSAVPNLLDHVLVAAPGSSFPGISAETSENGQAIIFSFTRHAASAGDTEQVFQYSTDMIEWTDANITGTPDDRVVLGPPNANGDQSVTVTVPKGGGSGMFGRLQVTRP